MKINSRVSPKPKLLFICTGLIIIRTHVRTPGWPQTVAKDYSEPLHPKSWDCKHVTMPSFNDIYTIILVSFVPNSYVFDSPIKIKKALIAPSLVRKLC